jgi:hypothetical protein
MIDKKKGLMDPRYKNEKLVSAIIEFTAPLNQLTMILEKVKETAQSIDTVFSLDLMCCFEDDGSLPVLPVLQKMGIKPRVNSKVNLGLGRPYKIIRQKQEA